MLIRWVADARMVCGRACGPGDVLDVPDTDADSLIAQGKAEPVAPEPVIPSPFDLPAPGNTGKAKDKE